MSLLKLFLVGIGLLFLIIPPLSSEGYNLPFSDNANRPANIDPGTVITTDSHGMWVVTEGSYYSGSQRTEAAYFYQEGSQIKISYMTSGVSFTVIAMPDPSPILSATMRPANMNPGTVLILENGQVWEVTEGSYYAGSARREEVIVYEMSGTNHMSFQTCGVEMGVKLLSDGYNLTVEKAGTGTGTVTGTGVNCGTDCTQTYAAGTVVVLTANADIGSIFTGWSGGGCSGTSTCTVTMDADVAVIATFALPDSPFDLSPTEGTIGTQLNITGTGFGVKKGKVLIGGIPTKISKDGWKNNIITCTITKTIPAGGPYHVTIRPYKTADITLPDAFTVKPPEIGFLDFYHGAAGVNSITITGNFFGTKKGKAYLEYEKNGQPKNKGCKVMSWGIDRITFVVPKGLVSGIAYPLKVTNKVGTAEAPSDFTID
jgi:hypothetical protein